MGTSGALFQFVFVKLEIPLDEVPDPNLDWRVWLVADIVGQILRICPRIRDITWLQRQQVLLRLFAETLLDQYSDTEIPSVFLKRYGADLVVVESEHEVSNRIRSALGRDVPWRGKGGVAGAVGFSGHVMAEHALRCRLARGEYRPFGVTGLWSPDHDLF